MEKENVVILGASDKSHRYSYMAMELLERHGHKTFLVHPRIEEVEGRAVYPSLQDIIDLKVKIHTMTMYVNKDRSSKMAKEIIRLRPKRIIFNPGSENPELESMLQEANIHYEHACTLVLLNTNQYDQELD